MKVIPRLFKIYCDRFCLFSFWLLIAVSCDGPRENDQEADPRNSSEYGASVALKKPYDTTPQNKYAKVLGWSEGTLPQAPEGYRVVKFADSLNSPRNVYVAPNGDVFIAQARTERTGEDDAKVDARNLFRDKSPNTILRLRDQDGDGIAERKEVVLSHLSQPYGMLILAGFFYVANTDGLIRYPVDEATGDIQSTQGEQIVELPAGGYNNHWTRNLARNPKGDKIYITVGSAGNAGEEGMEREVGRAAILEVDPDGSNACIYAFGLRNPVGLAFEPHSEALWTAVNERDQLGDELVPDYITSVRSGGFYGWPYSYWGKNVDPRWEGRLPDSLIHRAITPDYALGSHTASLGLAFSEHSKFEEGAYIGQHGSWNRSELVGYRVLYVPFEGGVASGDAEPFLEGFIANPEKGEVYGRPVAVTFTDAYLLVTDDAANVVWAVIPEG